ncbi:hypothetical protein [Burkholderia singularis]|uniref:Uncharacterized protein n=1 Tax=Burkholderia singularis TaxID=1503053 RepID=A0A238H1F6_9BURK|nr:hypothetical protein [Burkholderia singularis]SMF98990.1 FIG00455062: hypothetical protein [Burkholderia singularis]
MNIRDTLRNAAPADDTVDGLSIDDAERIVLTAMRSWLRCANLSAAHREPPSWRNVLADAGLHTDGLVHFDMLMRFLQCDANCPRDERCHCRDRLAIDEAMLLQALADLQSARSEAALRALAHWLPRCPDSGVLKIARWFSIALLDAGLAIRSTTQPKPYIH